MVQDFGKRSKQLPIKLVRGYGLRRLTLAVGRRSASFLAINGGDSVVQLRILTDMEEYSDFDTLSKLHERSEGVRHIFGLHAKLYIFDNQAIITSANLTKNGFDRNVEVGMLIREDVGTVAEFFERLWGNAAVVDAAGVESVKGKFGLSREKESASPSVWKLGSAASSVRFDLTNQSEISDYRKFLANYGNLRDGYSKINRLWPDMPLNLEVDAFLNFLYNDHPDKPSRAFFGPEKGVARTLTTSEQTEEIDQFAREFAAHDSINSPNKEWRKQRYELIRDKLAWNTIRDLTRQEADEVAACLHTLNSHGKRNLRRFEQSRNSIETIRKTWRELLHSPEGEELRIRNSLDHIHGFGRNSAQELLGWMFPNRLPIRNDNAEAGLYFLGYKYD